MQMREVWHMHMRGVAYAHERGLSYESHVICHMRAICTWERYLSFPRDHSASHFYQCPSSGA